MSILLSLLMNPTVLAILAGIAAVFGWGIRQRRAGAASERAKQAKADQRARDIADEIFDDVRAMSPEQVEAELRSRVPKKK
jgi:Flp pilus assembly protein TadB